MRKDLAKILEAGFKERAEAQLHHFCKVLGSEITGARI